MGIKISSAVGTAGWTLVDKAIKIWSGSAWVPVLKAWISPNGSTWSLFYPDYPINTAAPTKSATFFSPTYVATGTNGTWNSDAGYIPTSYSYQWLRNGVAISGASATTYTIQTADVGTTLSFQVTATNARGSTTAVSSGTVVVPILTTYTATDTTITPAGPSSVTGVGGNLSWTASWVAPSPATWVTTYAVTAIPTQVGETFSYAGGFSTTASATSAPAGSTQVLVLSRNLYTQFDISWSPAAGATSYDLYVGGVFKQNTTATSLTSVYVGSTGAFAIAIYPKVGTTLGNPATGTLTLNEKQSNWTYSPAFTVVNPVPGAFSVYSLIDSTPTPTTPSFASITDQGNNTLAASWGSSTYATEYLTIWSGPYSNAAQYFLGTASGSIAFSSSGQERLSVYGVNQTTQITVSWTTSANATGYTVNTSAGSFNAGNNTSWSYAASNGSQFTVNSVTATNAYGTAIGSGTPLSITPSSKISGVVNSAATQLNYTAPQVAVNAPSPQISYSSGPTWALSFYYPSQGSGAITSNWYFYTATSSSGAGQTLVNSGSVIHTASGFLYTIGNQGNGGNGMFWGQLFVSSSNSFSSASAATAWT
jgi:hypothetical protein